MMNQATSIIAEALLYSLLAGTATYTVLRLLLALLKNIPALIKYHLCNISLLIPLLIFIVSLTQLTTIKDTAPVYPTTPPVTINYTQTQVATPLQEETAQVTPVTAEMLWAEVHAIINENSQTITWLYIAGLLLFSIRLLLQYLQSQQLKTKGLLPATNEWHRQLANTMLRLNISRPIHIAFTERKISPCIIGHAKAVILIPISLANHLTTEQAEAILLHELAHYKQYDHYINLGVQCIKCLLFFNPFVWLQTILIDKYRELSCDETAARHERNIELAETLAMIAGIQARQNSLVMSLKKRSPLLVRVQALLQIRQYDKSSHRLLPLVVTTIVLATGLLIAGSTRLFSSEKDNLREQLKEISAQMYKEGNHRYVFVDAVVDSLVILPAKVQMLNMGSSYWTLTNNNGPVKVSTELSKEYKVKLGEFLVAQGEDADATVAFDAIPDNGMLTLKDIMNTNSDFRKTTAKDRYKAGITTRAWKEIYKAMYEDGLIRQPMHRFEMRYSAKGIEVNGRKLTGTLDAKYRKMYAEQLGLDLNRDDVSGRMQIGDLEKYLPENLTKNERDTADIRYQERNILLAQLFNELQKDGLADTNHCTEIEYRNGQVFLNLVRLETEAQGKYTGLLQKVISYLAKKADTHGTYIWYIEKPFPQYYYDRLNRFTEKEMLQHVSNELFNKGLTDYIMVDAVKDGYLQNGESYHIAYKDGVVTIKGKTLSIADQIAYNNKLEQYTRQFESKGWYGNTRSTVKMSDILDPKSGLRSKGRNEEKKGSNTSEYTSLIISEMHKDGLIDSAYQVAIIYTPDGVFANRVRLSGPLEEKYIRLFQKYEPDLIRGNDFSISITNNHDKPFPPTLKIEKQNGNLKTLSQQDKEVLTILSDSMFKFGSQSFAIIDAIKDGYIKQEEPYTINYRAGKFWINSADIPGNVAKKYEAKLEKFKKMHGHKVNMWGSVSSTVNGTVMDPEYVNQFGIMLPKPTMEEEIKEAQQKRKDEDFKKLIQAMDKDGLLDMKGYYLVQYKKDGLYVNAIKLTGSQEKKYTNWLNELGYTADKGMSTESVPDGVKIPDKRLGISTVSIPVHGNNLPAVAQVMFVDGNPNFILAHALHDGLLREGQRYDIRYMRGKVYSKGELIAAPYQSRYARLITDFTRVHNKNAGSYAVHGDGVTKKELNTPESAIRQDIIKKGQALDAGKVVGKVIGMMAADGVVDTTKRFTLQYNAKGLFVNNKKLISKEAQKYEEILNKELWNDSRITTFNEINFEHDPN